MRMKILLLMVISLCPFVNRKSNVRMTRFYLLTLIAFLMFSCHDEGKKYNVVFLDQDVSGEIKGLAWLIMMVGRVT